MASNQAAAAAAASSLEEIRQEQHRLRMSIKQVVSLRIQALKSERASLKTRVTVLSHQIKKEQKKQSRLLKLTSGCRRHDLELLLQGELQGEEDGQDQQ